MLLHLTFSQQPSIFAPFFFREGSVKEIHNSCCRLRRPDHWLCVERDFVQLQWVISVRLCYPRFLRALWCNAVPVFIDLVHQLDLYFTIRPQTNRQIRRLCRRRVPYLTHRLAFQQQKERGVLNWWSLLQFFLIHSHKFVKMEGKQKSLQRLSGFHKSAKSAET